MAKPRSDGGEHGSTKYEMRRRWRRREKVSMRRRRSASKFWCWTTMCVWTDFGHKKYESVQNMSKMCPKNVQNVSIHTMCPNSVQKVSKLRPNGVQMCLLCPKCIQTNAIVWTLFRHFLNFLDTFLTSCKVSKICPKCVQKVSKHLDTFWTHHLEKYSDLH